MTETRILPVEVELALQVMPCQAMRRTYPVGATPHPCAHFGEWGVFHAFDYAGDQPPPRPGIAQPSIYAGKRQVIPEILSGCRKAPILAVGINPNLPGWSPSTRNAIHPYFEDYLQYAHYFRWRATDKLRIPAATYAALRPAGGDGPEAHAPLIAPGEAIAVEPAPVTMYEGYQSLLDGLADTMGWAGHHLRVGEDIAYANMVACGSARWTTRPVPDMPVMGEARARGIVQECFRDRKYFLRQMLQSLPAVVIVFSQTTADAFIAAMRGRFAKGDPQVGEKLPALLAREIRLRLGKTADGAVLDTRVIFSPHASANPQDFAARRAAIVAQLAAEVNAGGLGLNPATGHLARTRGGCQFCDNALYSIGRCDYRAELTPLAAGGGVDPLADGGRPNTAAERAEHLRLVDAFTAVPATAEPALELLDAEAPFAPRLALLGDIVPMAGPPLANGAIYLHKGEIVAVQPAADPPPPDFAATHRVDTGGVIYPGLVDLHNHLAYNALSLWAPAQARTNRSQWQRDRDYKRRVLAPMKMVAQRQDLVKAVVRYVETKLMLGGTTSGQGMKTNVQGLDYFHGAVRNFEQPDDPALPKIGHRILDLVKDQDIVDMRRSLDRGVRFFFHLAEGTDAAARRQFELLRDNGLLRANLVGVHSLGLVREDLDLLAAAGGSVVWSPLSNSILYGRTLNVADLLGSGAKFALGSDWTPSGSRNILQELKVAKLAADAQGVDLSAERLAHAVTADASDLAGWGDKLGRLTAGRYADLLVLDRVRADPYDNLLHATEREVRLVVIAGHPRHGDRDLMLAAGAATARLEPITIGGRRKALNLSHRASLLNHVDFGAARDALARAFADLPAARDATVFEPFSNEPEIELELEMQDDADAIDFLADEALIDSIALDPATVIDDAGYWTTIDAIGHLPAWLKGPDGLQRFYG